MKSLYDLEKEVIASVKEFAYSINSGEKVVADMTSLIDVTSQLALSNFDYWERLIRDEFYKALNDLPQPRGEAWLRSSKLLTWLDLISWDGYKREKTLRTISRAAPNSFFFCLAIRRLNDWVPQVREAAREKLPQIAIETDPSHIAEALCITLANWHSWGRIEEIDKQLLLKIISNKAIIDSLKHILMSSASGPMVLLFSQLGRTSVLDEHLSEISEYAIQPSVRAKAYRSQFESRIVWAEGQKWEWTDIRYSKGRWKTLMGERKLTTVSSFKELLQKSAKDRSSIVRRVSAEFLIKEISCLDDELLGLAKCFALDKSSPVAERGKFALKMLEEFKI